MRHSEPLPLERSVAISWKRASIPGSLALLLHSSVTLRMSAVYANALYNDPSATLDDLRESVTTLEDTAPIARRVLGGAHPLTGAIENHLRDARAALRRRETPPSSSPSGDV